MRRPHSRAAAERTSKRSGTPALVRASCKALCCDSAMIALRAQRWTPSATLPDGCPCTVAWTGSSRRVQEAGRPCCLRAHLAAAGISQHVHQASWHRACDQVPADLATIACHPACTACGCVQRGGRRRCILRRHPHRPHSPLLRRLDRCQCCMRQAHPGPPRRSTASGRPAPAGSWPRLRGPPSSSPCHSARRTTPGCATGRPLHTASGWGPCRAPSTRELRVHSLAQRVAGPGGCSTARARGAGTARLRSSG